MSATNRTPEKELAFLTVLADTCNVSKACKAIGECRSVVYEWRAADPDFADRWDRAKRVGADVLEDEAVRRAHDGIEEPRFDKEGKLSGTVVKYSDTLLIFLLNGAKPDKYRQRVSSEISGPGGAPIPIDHAAIPDEIAGIIGNAAARQERGEDLA